MTGCPTGAIEAIAIQPALSPPPRSGYDHIDLPAAAARTDEPFAPIRVLIAETVARCERDRVNSPRHAPIGCLDIGPPADR